MPTFTSIFRLILFIAVLVLHHDLFAQCTSVNFTANKTQGCAPLGVVLVATGVPAGARIEWNLGGGFINGKDTAFKYFTGQGKTTISLRITENGKTTPCTTVVKTDYIEVLPKPKIKLYRSDSLLCAGPKSVLIIDSTVGVSSRTWIYDGTQQSTTGATLTKTPSEGNHDLSLLVKNSFGCESVYKNSKAISVYAAVTIEVCGNLVETPSQTVGSFTGNVLNSTRKATGYSWSFPDASPSSSTASNPKGITYKAPIGASDVTLKMTFEGGCTYTDTKTDFVVPFLTADDDSVCVKQEIKVTNLASGGGRKDFSMGFPGANFLSGDIKSDFKISYTSTGSKSIDYSFKYANGDKACQTTVKAENLIEVMGPVARAFSNDRNDCVLDSVLLQSSSIVPTTGTNLYTWRVYNKHGKLVAPTPKGPGKNLSKYNIMMPSLGVYSVTLIVENTKNGCLDSTYLKNYLRLKKPDARIKFSDSVICSDDALTMESVSLPPPSSGNPYTYSWLVQHADSTAVKFDAATQKFSRRLRIPGKYHVRLIVKSNSTCADTITLLNHVEVQGIMATIKVKDKIGCPVFTTDVSSDIQFIYPPTSTPNYTYQWEMFPDKHTSIADDNADKTSITISKTKCYNIKLVINDVYGCKKELEQGGVCIGAKANFGWDPDSLATLCLNQPFAMVDSSMYNANIYLWSVDKPGLKFSDSSDRAPKITFTSSGKYKIKLLVKSGAPAFCADSIEREIEIIAPEAKFKVDKPLTNCAPQQLTFTNESVNADTYKWIYGDGNTSANSNTEHSYVYTKNSISGFLVKLVAYKTGSKSCADTFELLSKVKIVGPSPLFNADTLFGCDSQLVTYYNLTNPVNAQYVFDYGDGTAPDSNRIRPHKYVFNGAPGEDSIMYFPTLVASSFGCDAYFSDTIIIYRAPNGSFIADTLEGCRPLLVQLTNTSSNYQRFYWDLWNDNTKDSINQDVVSLLIDTVGKFGVSLTAKMGTCTSTMRLDSAIKVDVAPRARFAMSVDRGCDTMTVFFANQTFPAKADVIIDYGDGTPPDTNNITKHLYTYPTSHPDDSVYFYPRVTASSFGCTNVFTDTILLYRGAVVDFSIDTTIGCQPLQVVLVYKGGVNFGYEWDVFNDGIVEAQNQDTLIITLDTFGYFAVRASALYKGGCVTNKIVDSLIRVVDVPKPGFSMDLRQACDSLTVKFTDLTTPAFTSYVMDYGDGSPLDSNTINDHTYRLPIGSTADSVVYYPTLRGTRVLCPAFFLDSVIVYRSPKAAFSIDTIRGCQEAAFLLIDQSTPTLTKTWDIYRDGVIDGLDLDSLAFLSDTVGHWGVSLWVEYLGGCTDELVIDSLFEVLRSPKPRISYAVLQSCDTLTLEVNTNNPKDSFILDYGNGKADTNKTSRVFYDIPANWLRDTFTYILTYKVFNPSLSVCQGTMQDSLLLFQGPTIGFMADTLRGCSPLTVRLTDTTQRALTYAWDFNADGQTDDTNKVAIANLAAGWTPIVLTVTTVEGCKDSLSRTRYIRVHQSPQIRIISKADLGCANRGIQFVDSSLLDTNVMYRKWDFGFTVHPDQEVVPNPTVSFPATGNYTVHLWVVDSNSCQGLDSVSIDIVNLDTPSANHFQRLWHTSLTQIELQWLAPSEPDFESFDLIRVVNGDSSLISINTGGYSDVLGNGDDLATYYLQWTDTCGNRSELSEPLYNIVLAGDNLLENVLRLRWMTLGQGFFNSYNIYRREPGTTAWNLLGSTGAAAKTYIDSAACRASYEYMVEGITALGISSGSHWIRLTGQFKEKTLPLQLHVATVVNDDSVQVVWERNNHPAHQQYLIDRQDPQGVWQIRFDSTLSNRYFDTSVNVSAEYFRYRVYAQDACGNTNPVSNPGSSIRLLGHSKTGRIALAWNDYQSWPEGYDFVVQARFGQGKFADMAMIYQDSVRYTDRDLHEGMDTPWCYRVVALRQGPRTDSSISNTYCDFFSYGFFIPNAFSPNGDGLNEMYGIAGESIKRPDLGHILDFELKIIDRWGQVMFYSTDPRQEWDGTRAGTEISDGLYYYQVYIKTKSGAEHLRNGPFFILR